MEMQMCVSASKDKNGSPFPMGQERKRANDHVMVDNVIVCHKLPQSPSSESKL